MLWLKLSLPANHLNALTLPGPGTTQGTLTNAHRLAQTAGVSLQEIDIKTSVAQHLEDLEHEGAHDVVFENAQARERTQILFNYANKVGACGRYRRFKRTGAGLGDVQRGSNGELQCQRQCAKNTNGLLSALVRATSRQTRLAEVLIDVLNTPISPELIPPQDGEISQRTEDVVGPYELHDFFLYHWLRFRRIADQDLPCQPAPALPIMSRR